MDANTFSDAIAFAEGFHVEHSIPQRANNPGDLKYGDIGHGVLGEGITVFPDVATGRAALVKQATLMLSGRSKYYTLDMTLAQVGMKYSGSSDWSKNVAAYLKFPETVTLKELASADVKIDARQS